MKDKKKNIAAVEFYSKSQYALLLEKAFDAEKLDQTWDEWFNKFSILKSKLKKIGITCKEVFVDVNELQDFCAMNGYKNNETTRTVFVSYVYAYTK